MVRKRRSALEMVMDAELLAHWDEMATYHERQEERWLLQAELRAAYLASRRATISKSTDLEGRGLQEKLEQAVQAGADVCRSMAEGHQQMRPIGPGRFARTSGVLVSLSGSDARNRRAP
jgi:hypothetical protein